MKTVGVRQQSTASLEDARQLLKTAAELRPVGALVPRGIYYFSSFEEADLWMRRTIASTLARHKSKISSGSAAP